MLVISSAIGGFTAAQAAQKSGAEYTLSGNKFTAAQAAQKTMGIFAIAHQQFTAAQAAQKSDSLSFYLAI